LIAIDEIRVQEGRSPIGDVERMKMLIRLTPLAR